MRTTLLALLAFWLAGCTLGSTTTARPALSLPPVSPEGTLWSAIEVSRADNPASLLHVLSPGFLHASFIPLRRFDEPATQAELERLRVEVDTALERAAMANGHNLELEKLRLATGYATFLRELARDRLIEVGPPSYDDIRFRDEFNRAWGPNVVRLQVQMYPKEPLPEDFVPEVLTVIFIQDGNRWLIEGFDPDPQKGTYVWTQ